MGLQMSQTWYLYCIKYRPKENYLMKKNIIFILFIASTFLIPGCFAHSEPVESYEHVRTPRVYRSVVYERPLFYGLHRQRTHRYRHSPRKRVHVHRSHHNRVYRKRVRPQRRVYRKHTPSKRRVYTRPKPKLKKRTVRRYYNKNGKLRKRVIRRRYR